MAWPVLALLLSILSMDARSLPEPPSAESEPSSVTFREGMPLQVRFQPLALAAPIFLSEPMDREVEMGDDFFLMASALGAEPMSYHWLRNGVPATNGFSFNAGTYFGVGAVTAERDAGFYVVIASNSWGTATSRVARLTVRPPPPNPEFAGYRMISLAETGVAIEGSPHRLGTIVYTSGTRWLGDEVLFPALSLDSTHLGLLGAAARGLHLRLRPGLELPNGLGPTGGYALPDLNSTNGPLIVLGLTNRLINSCRGIYRVEGENLIPLVDLRSPVPGAPDTERFQSFDGAVQRGERIAFVASTAQRWGVYLWSTSRGVERLMDTTMDIPSLGANGRRLYGLGWDGDRAAVGVWNDRVGFVAVLSIDAAGRVEPLFHRGDPLPGTTVIPNSIDRLYVESSRVYASGSHGVLEWNQGTWSERLKVGSLVDAWGGVLTFMSGALSVVNGDVFVSAGPSPAHFAIRAARGGANRLLLMRKVDGRPIGFNGFASIPLATAPGRVAVLVMFPSGAIGLYANLGSVLHYERLTGGGLRLAIPAGHVLEQASQPMGPWTAKEASEFLDEPGHAAEGYFRLRRP